ncbi:MAG: hypothetical protein HY290_10600 [Planctomycetia bacterium]|nr:hypothetical protein [Planctomycetia bacterium]
MGLTETIVFYLMFGAGIAAAVALRNDGAQAPGRWFRIATAVFFWPLYLPLMLDRPARRPPAMASREVGDHASADIDDYAATIARVEAELETALDSLDGWAENVLSREHDRFAELRAAWRSQADRIRQLDRLLATADQPAPGPADAAAAPAEGNARYRLSEQARRENIERLHAVRRRLHEDLSGTLAWVRELVSMIHLAKFTGAPASRAEELVAQIATAVEGLSEVTQWRDEPAGVGR